MQTRNPFGQLVDVLARQGNQDAARTQRYNPRPPGVLRPGGVPLLVLAHLKANPDRYFTFKQLAMATNKSNKALDWACLGLRGMGFVETRPDPRQGQYLQYKYLQDGGQL